MKSAASPSILPLLVCTCMLLSACATSQPVIGPAGSDQKTSAELPNALQISDIPIPNGAKFDTENSLIIGANDGWLGRIVIKTDIPPIQAFNHFYNGMPSLGWGLVTIVQARISMLTYMRGERVASIQIEPSSMGGATASITVSSRQGNSRESARPK